MSLDSDRTNAVCWMWGAAELVIIHTCGAAPSVQGTLEGMDHPRRTGGPAQRIQGMRGKQAVRQRGFIRCQLCKCINKYTAVIEQFLSSSRDKAPT